jgi:hypothetical protein
VMALSPVDRLLAESERLRVEMLRTADQLKKFSDELLVEVRALRAEAGPPIERGDDLDDRAESGS